MVRKRRTPSSAYFLALLERFRVGLQGWENLVDRSNNKK